MEKKTRNSRKNEKGAITLFVLLACLFFVFILSGVYISNLNKIQNQEREVKQIQENYAKDLDRIEEVYEEIVGNIKVTLTQEPAKEVWTNIKVMLTGHAIVEKGEQTIEYYVFSQNPNPGEIAESEWKKAGNPQEISPTIEVEENGQYYFYVKDNEETIKKATIEVTNIDKNNPTAGTIKGIERENGEDVGEYSFDARTSTDKDLYIYISDKGSDAESEVTTTYKIKTLKYGSIQNYTSEETVTLTETGIYEITVTTTDEAGNVTDRDYVVIIDKNIPILTLKHNNATGTDYESGTWTKDDLYGEINIDTSETGKTLEKYQYSYDLGNWNDISSEMAQTRIDYTTTFPVGEDKPDWFTGPISANSSNNSNGTYYFEVQEDGTLKPNNSGVNSTTANSYFEIDLESYPKTTELEITINATISSEKGYDFGYATITESETAPAYNATDGRFIYVSGPTTTAEHTTILTGGTKYYLHIGYRKDSSSASNQDTFIINSINLKSDNLSNKIKFYEYARIENKVTFKLQEEMIKKFYIRAVYEGQGEENKRTSKYGSITSIKIDKTAPIIQTVSSTLTSHTTSQIDVTVQEDDSELRGYYISTEETEPTEESTWTEQTSNEFTIEGLNTGTTYYIWTIDNAGNISEKKQISTAQANYSIDDSTYVETLAQAITQASSEGGSTIKLLNDYADESTVAFDRNVTFDVQSYTLIRSATITINSSKTVEITGTGKITSGSNSVNTITNNGILTISNSITIENMSTSSSNAPIYTNSSSSVTNINDNVKIIGYYIGIYDYYGTVNVNGGYIEATYSNSSAYGIYNNSSSSKTYIYNGEVRGYTGIYNYSSSLVEIIGGKIVGTGAYGINAYGTTNIYGGKIEGKTYGIYSTATDKVTIGKQEDELSTTTPAIYGGNYGIYMSNVTYNFNFYNGVIISNTKEAAYRGVANLRENHMTYTYLDYEVEQKYCTILIPTVENITMEATPAEYTNGNVTVKITYPYIEGITRQYSEDGTEWQEAEQYIQEVVVTENKMIYARTMDESGIIMDENQITVNNIDKEKPIVTVSPEQTQYIVIEENGTADISLTIKAEDAGVSGLDIEQYAWVKEEEELTYIDFTNEITINKTNLSIGQYNLYLKVTDKAGNEAELQQIRYNVKYQEPVCQIGEIKYLTIQEAIDACSKEAGENQTTIEIIKSTDEEFSTYEGQNIIIDLKGYTIGSSNQEIPICTNNGKLTVIDTSTEKTGKLESLNGTTILNKTTGEIIIGDNSTSIEPNTPTIYGKKVGIKNEGILNFYDGKIQGTAPIQGKVTNTPEGYGPVSTEYNNGITTIQLGIVSGYEARIEWVYYTTVQEAIDATKLYKNGYRDTVTIIKDIQLKEIAEIDTNKNMILDLDRYTLTIVPEKDKVIENYGNLEITDSSTEQTGKIEITSSKTGTSSSKTIQTIAVNNNGILNVSGGTISSATTGNYNYSYGVYNASSGSVTVSGGTVSSSSSYSSIYTYSCGIYNDSSGSVTVSGGTVSSSCSSSSSCGIYNNSIGNVTVNGGTVISSSSSNYTNLSSYGIYNWSTGNVEVSGGTVSSSSSSSSYGIYNYGSGSLTVSGGTVSSSNSSSSSSCGIYNASSGSITVSGGTVSSSSNNSFSYGIYNSKGNVIITGGTVSSNGYGIYNADSGNVTVEGGAVSSSSSGRNSYGIYNNSGNIIISGGTVSSSSTKYSYGIYNYSSGTIIIGDKSSDTLTREEPNIKGKYTGASSSYDGYGLYNKDGNVEFYNGTVQGSNIALEGTITKIKEGYKIENSTIEDKDTIYLVEKIEEENIVQIESIKYTSLQEAMNSIEENEEKTIEVIKDFELDEVISNTKNIILDLQGHTMTNKYYRIENIGNLKITDTTENKEGKIESIETIIGILNKEGGNINVAGGTVSSSSSSSSSYGIFNDGIGDVIVNGGTVSSSGNGGFSYSYGIYNSKGNVIITGGAVSSSSSGGSSYGIYNASSGRVTVSGGTVSGGDSGIHNISTGSIEVSGGTVSSSIYGIYNASTGDVIVNGGTVSCSRYGIYNRSSGNVEVRGGTVSSSGGGSSSYGIYNDNSTGSITIGTKGDGLVSEEEPYIKGEYTGTSTSYVGYGIYNTSGKLYYYDGKIEGSTKAVYDTITEIEENTELNYNEDETILTLTTEITDIAQIGEITYATIQEAIEEVGTEQETIKILRNVTYTNNDTSITIPNTKNIKLDLNGYKITSSIPEKVIQNEGKLEIIDTSEEQTGTIITNEETTIKNIEGAQLVISGGTIENRTKQAIYNEGENIIAGGIISSSGNYGIYNASTGSIEVSGGTVRSINNNSNSYGIYNYDSGNVEVRGGTISSSGSYSYGIYNASSGNVTVIGGTVSSSQYGIYNNNTGSITIGAKGDGLVSQEEPKIKGNEYGTYNLQGTLSIYDGKIAGTTRGVYGNIVEIEDLTELLISTETIDSSQYEVIQLQQKETNVSQVNEVEYDSIQKAIQACGETESTIQILRDTDPGIPIIIEENQNITIDLNGYTIRNYTEITNTGILKIVDTSSGQTGKMIGLAGIVITNQGTMEIQSGSISDSGYGIKNTGTLTVSGGNISNNTYGIYNDSKGTTTVTNGIMSSNTYGIYNYASTATTNIAGGSLSSNTYGIYNYNGTTTITSTEMTNNEYGIYNTKGNVNVNNNITGGTYSIYNAGGTTNIKEGSQISSNTGIYNSSGTVNIGEQGTMNPDTPIIIGEEYGLVNVMGATANIYDGQIKGKIGATQGYIAYTETGYAVANKTEGEYFIDYLALTGTISTVAEVNGIAFSNLQSAINSVIGEEEQTVKLTNGITTSTTLHIGEGQNIILDMNGKTISSDLDVTLINNGNLTIIDSSESNVAKISNTAGTAINNTGTLSLGQDDGTVTQNLINIDGTTYGIQNSGTLNFYDGTINGASAVSGTITSRATGYVIRTTTVNSKERYYLSK